MKTETRLPLDQLINGTDDIILAKDLEGRHVVINQAGMDFLGLPADEVIGKTDEDLFPGGRGRIIMDLDRRVIKADARTEGIESVELPEGEFFFQTTKWPWKENGTTLGTLAIVRNVTNEHNAERRVNESEELYRTTLASISDTVMITDDHGSFTWVCPNVNHIFGYSEPEIYQLANVDAVLKDLKFDNDIFDAEQEVSNVEIQVTDKLGAPHDLLVNIKKVKIGAGTVLYTCRDITERRQAQQESEESSRRLQSILDNSPATIFMKDEDGRYQVSSSMLEELLGKSADQILGRTDEQIFPPEIAEQILKNDRQVLEFQQPIATEENIEVVSGLRHYLSTKFPVFEGEGPAKALGGIAIDITEMKKTQQALVLSEKKYREFVEETEDLITQVDSNGLFTFVNSQADAFLGVPPDRCIGLKAFDFIHPDDKEETQKQFADYILCRANTGHFENRQVAKSGAVHHMQWTSRFNYDESGKVTTIHSTARDVTNRHAIEKALRESETRFRNLTEETIDWIWEVNDSAVYTYCSPAVTNLLGHLPDDVIGKTPFDLMPPEEAKRVAEIFGPITQAQEPFTQLENVNLHTDGSLVVMETSGVPIFNDAGEFKGYRGIDRDITDKKSAELELRKEKELGDALTAIEMMLSSTLELDSNMPEILTRVVQTLNADAACLDMHDRDYWALSHCDLGAREYRLCGDERIRNNRTIVIENAELVANRDDGYLGLPIVQKDKLIGVMSFLWDENSRPEKADIDFSRKLSFLLSLAIENSRLYQAERDIANTLQSSLLSAPKELKGVESGQLYHSATEAATVGGDFYDLIDLGKGRIGVVLGDVSGKGIGASALTSLVKHTLRAHAFDGERPEVIISKTSEAVLRNSDPSNFVTVFFGILDTRGGIIEYCCAGHPAPIYLTTDKAEISNLTMSPAIGMFPETEFQHGTMTLRPRDRLVLYTDGITEARQNHGDMYGEDRLQACLNASLRVTTENIPKTIFDDVLAHAGGVLQDDVAILTISLSRSS